MLVISDAVLDDAQAINVRVDQIDGGIKVCEEEVARYLAKANELVVESIKVYNEVTRETSLVTARETLLKGDNLVVEAAGYRRDAMVNAETIKELDIERDRLLGILVWMPTDAE